MKTRRNVKRKRMATNKHKRMATNKLKRMATNKHKRSAKKSKRTRRHSKKRVRFVTRKMRGGMMIQMKPYPSNFSKKDKNEQKKDFKLFSKEINEICKKINGLVEYKYLPVEERKELLVKFNADREKYVKLIDTAQVDLNNMEYNENDKVFIDLINIQHHTENLLNTLMECYSNYTHVEVVKDSAGKPQNLKKNSLDSLKGVENDPMFEPLVRPTSHRSGRKSIKSHEYIEIDPKLMDDEFTDFKAEKKKPPSLKPRNNINNNAPASEPPVDVIVVKQHPRRRSLRRGKKTEVPVLPEYTAALDAIADLDKFLSSERKKMSK